MKKYLSLMLSIVLLLCAVIPVSATEEYVSSSALDSALIVHNAFDGTTATEQKSDTATGGYSKEAVTILGTTANGVTTVSGTSTTLNYCGGGTTNTAKGQDIVGNDTGALTIMISFKVTATDPENLGSGYCDVFRFNDSDDIRVVTTNWTVTETTATADLYWFTSTNGGCTEPVKLGTIPISCGDIQNDTFIYFALTMKYDKTAGTWDYVSYLSVDGGMTYTSVEKNDCTGTEQFYVSTTTTYRWWKLGNSNGGRTNSSQTFDDFRIYNKALSLPEIKYEVPGVTGAVLHGVQTSNVSDTYYSVRFVGSIESKDYHEVGFKVTAQNGAYKWHVSAGTVFSSLNANTDKGLESYTAKSLRGSDSGYLYALSINEIPTKDSGNDLTVTFIVTPYSIKNEGDDPVFGTAYTIVYKAGVYQSSAVYTAPTT